MHRSAADEMEMNVEHRLSGFAVGVEDGPKAAGRDATLLRDRCRSPHQFSRELVIVGRQVVQRRDVALRHDENVRRSLRVDVVERDDAIILIDNRRRDLSIDDAAEETFGHKVGGSQDSVRSATAVRPL